MSRMIVSATVTRFFTEFDFSEDIFGAQPHNVERLLTVHGVEKSENVVLAFEALSIGA